MRYIIIGNLYSFGRVDLSDPIVQRVVKMALKIGEYAHDNEVSSKTEE